MNTVIGLNEIILEFLSFKFYLLLFGTTPLHRKMKDQAWKQTQVSLIAIRMSMRNPPASCFCFLHVLNSIESWITRNEGRFLIFKIGVRTVPSSHSNEYSWIFSHWNPANKLRSQKRERSEKEGCFTAGIGHNSFQTILIVLTFHKRICRWIVWSRVILRFSRIHFPNGQPNRR